MFKFNYSLAENHPANDVEAPRTRLDEVADLAKVFSKAVDKFLTAKTLGWDPSFEKEFDATMTRKERAERDRLMKTEHAKKMTSKDYIRLAELDAIAFMRAGGEEGTLKGLMPLRAFRDETSEMLKPVAPVLSWLTKPQLRLVK